MKSYWFPEQSKESFDEEADDYDSLFGPDVEKVSAEQREHTGVRYFKPHNFFLYPVKKIYGL